MPVEISWFAMSMAKSTGIAKPMPADCAAPTPPEGDWIRELMPTSRPWLVNERTTGVAGVDGGVGLDEVGVGGDVVRGLSLRLLRALQRRDDAARDRLLESERAADRHHELPHLQVLGRTRLGRRIAAAFDLEDGEVRGGIDAHDGGLLVLEPDGDDDPVGALDHVVVGEDMAVGADDDSGSGARLAKRPVPGEVGHGLLNGDADH